jgi:sulfopropanediol 3-dehydrogenase
MADVLKDATAKSAHGANPELTAKVGGIIADIERDGEAAVRTLSQQFDNWNPESFRLSD